VCETSDLERKINIWATHRSSLLCSMKFKRCSNWRTAFRQS